MSEDVTPKLWRVELIARLCVQVESIDPRQKFSGGSFRYVDISSVDNDAKSITEARTIDVVEAPSRARQVIAAGDVLVSTVRPGLNAVAIVPDDLDGQICSTGFCVLRPQPNLLDSDYLFYWVRSSQFVERLVRMERGIGYPAVSDSDVKSVLIPLPPISEQRRIVDILCQANELRRLRREANRRAEDFLPALFQQMFGDPIRPIEGRDTKALGEFADVTSSLVDPRQSDYKEFVHVGSDSIESHTGRLIGLRSIIDVGSISGKFLFTDQNVLYSKIRPALVKVATPDFTGLCSADIYPLSFDPQQVTKQFLAQLLRSVHFTTYVMRVSGRAQIPKVNRDDLLKYRTVVPHLDTQLAFEECADQVRALQTRTSISLATLDTLSSSLLTRAFTGQLTAAWRSDHVEQLSQEAAERDRRSGSARPISLVVAPEPLPLPVTGPRAALVAALGKRQRRVLDAIEDYRGHFTAEQLAEDTHIELPTIRRCLELLVVVGLVQLVGVMTRPGTETMYVRAHRQLGPMDDVRLTMLERLSSKRGMP